MGHAASLVLKNAMILSLKWLMLAAMRLVVCINTL